jgi:hypothetical protein
MFCKQKLDLQDLSTEGIQIRRRALSESASAASTISSGEVVPIVLIKMDDAHVQEKP